MNQKSLDKKKTKELEWEKEFYKKYRSKLVQTLDSSTTIDWIFSVKQFIKQTLTQQRRELLEEILNLECLKEKKPPTVFEDDDALMTSIKKESFYIITAQNQLRKEIKEEINKL